MVVWPKGAHDGDTSPCLGQVGRVHHRKSAQLCAAKCEGVPLPLSVRCLCRAPTPLFNISEEKKAPAATGQKQQIKNSKNI